MGHKLKLASHNDHKRIQIYGTSYKGEINVRTRLSEVKHTVKTSASFVPLQ